MQTPAELNEMLFGELAHLGPRSMLPRGVTRRRCGLSLKFSEHFLHFCVCLEVLWSSIFVGFFHVDSSELT